MLCETRNYLFMKNTIIALLVTILAFVILNFLVGIGAIPAFVQKAPVFEYKALEPQGIDNIGFRMVAAEEGIAVGEDGKINFPKELVQKLVKVNLLPRTLGEVEKDGGWEFVAVTADDHYLFRRKK